MSWKLKMLHHPRISKRKKNSSISRIYHHFISNSFCFLSLSNISCMKSVLASFRNSGILSWGWGWIHDDLNINSFSLGRTAGSSKPVVFLKFSVLHEILVFVEFTLFELLLFPKFVRFQNGKTCESNYCQIVFNGKFSLFWNSDWSECLATVGH